MTFYGNNDWRDYLAHYGVKGMKWDEHKYTGVVNGEYVYGNNPVTKQATTALISKAKHVVSVIKKQKKTSGRNKIVGNRKGPFYDPIYESDVKKEKDEKSSPKPPQDEIRMYNYEVHVIPSFYYLYGFIYLNFLLILIFFNKIIFLVLSSFIVLLITNI